MYFSIKKSGGFRLDQVGALALDVLVFAVLSQSSLSFARVSQTSVQRPILADFQVSWDSGGMPRCLSAAGKVPVLLKWDQDEKYARTVLAIPLSRSLVEMQRPSGRFKPEISCRRWKSYSASVPSFYGVQVTEGQELIFDYLLNSQLRLALSQVRLGADEFRSEGSAEEYLAAHPIERFDLETNRLLTRKFGVAFASELFKAWVEAKPANREFKQTVVALLMDRGLAIEGALSDRFRNVVMIRVPGLGHETRSSQRFEVFTDQLKYLGVPILKVESGSMDPVRKNVEITRDFIDRVLSEGKDVVILAQSKGGTEAVEALSLLKDKLEGSSRPQNYGRVLAYVGMSGVYDHSFLVNWAAGWPQWWILKGKLLQSLREDGAAVANVDGFLDLGREPMNSYLHRVSERGLPQRTVYLSVAGAIEGDGRAQDASVRQVQDQLIRGQLKRFGANDGYIEFPGTLLSEKWAPRAFSLVMNGSHALVDGEFAGYRLQDPQQVRGVAYALLEALFRYVQ